MKKKKWFQLTYILAIRAEKLESQLRKEKKVLVFVVVKYKKDLWEEPVGYWFDTFEKKKKIYFGN